MRTFYSFQRILLLRTVACTVQLLAEASAEASACTEGANSDVEMVHRGHRISREKENLRDTEMAEPLRHGPRGHVEQHR